MEQSHCRRHQIGLPSRRGERLVENRELRQLAKLQMTWLLAMTGIDGFDCLDGDLAGRVGQSIDRSRRSRGSAPAP